jgi:hypothetical protein
MRCTLPMVVWTEEDPVRDHGSRALPFSLTASLYIYCIIPYPGPNTSSSIVICTWNNVLIPRNRLSYLHGCLRPWLLLQRSRHMHLAYNPLHRAQYIVYHSNLYVEQCINLAQSIKLLTYVLENLAATLEAFSFNSCKFAIFFVQLIAEHFLQTFWNDNISDTDTRSMLWIQTYICTPSV